MSITTLARYKQQIAEACFKFRFSKGSTSSGEIGQMCSTWTLATVPSAGAVPSTSAALDRTTTGAFTIPASTTNLRCLRGLLANTRIGVCGITLIDRLVHQGGLSGTVTTAQTTNLPTAALTRYTSGAGVMAALEIYTAVGATGTTATVSYTNQAGTSGRTSSVMTFGATGYNAATRFMIIPLDPADTGVRSVESVTLAATTGTAGNFGVTLFKPISLLPHFARSTGLGAPFDQIMNGGLTVEVIDPSACLMLLMNLAASSTATYAGEVELAED